MPVDVLRVTGGQDQGALFAMRGGEATIGRGPVMDIVLTDPRVSRRHARLRVQGAALLVEDLGSTAGTAVNGAPVARPTALARGDRLTLGATEMIVLWTPGGPPEPGPPPPRDPPPAPAPARGGPPPSAPPPGAAPPPEAAPGAAAAPRGPRADVILPAAALALGAFVLAGTWMPFVRAGIQTAALWDIPGLRAQALAAGALALACAAAWAASGHPRGRPWRGAAALATAAAGGAVAGLPVLAAAARPAPGATPGAGVPLLALAGIAIAACGVAGVARAVPRAPAGPPSTPALAVAAGGAGALLAAVSAALPWGEAVPGLPAPADAGPWILPLALAGAAAAGLAPALARTAGRHLEAPCAAAAAALSAAALTFAAASSALQPTLEARAGAGVAMAGSAVALTTALLGGAAMLVRGRPV